MANYFGGGYITTSITGQSSGGTLTLTGQAPGRAQAVSAILIRAAGTTTTCHVQVSTTAGSANIAYFGFDGAIPNGGVFTFPVPIIGLPNDAIVITVTAAGATASSLAIAALYKIVNA